MEDEEEDDIYAPDERVFPDQKYLAGNGATEDKSITREANANGPEEEESGEEIEEAESESV